MKLPKHLLKWHRKVLEPHAALGFGSLCDPATDGGVVSHEFWRRRRVEWFLFRLARFVLRIEPWEKRCLRQPFTCPKRSQNSMWRKVEAEEPDFCVHVESVPITWFKCAHSCFIHIKKLIRKNINF